jgi:glycine oxidase
MRKQSDVIVIGAGIVGLMTARELARAGALVRLYERGESGREATYAAGGILSPIPPWDAPEPVGLMCDWSRTRYAALVAELNDETDIDGEWIESGVLLFRPSLAKAAIAWGRASGRHVELLDREQILEREPAAGREWSQALFFPDIAQVRNHRFAKALAASVCKLGVELHEHDEVRGLHVQGRRVAGVETTDGTVYGGTVVLCAGAWSDNLLRPWGGELAVRPVRGQMLWYESEPGMLQRMLIDDTHYLIPRRDGVCIVGSTVEEVGFNKATTTAAASELARAAERLCPQLHGREPAGQWAGLRPGSVDGVPQIGAHPFLDGLYVNAGHYRNGIILAPASARLVAELVRGVETTFDPADYAPRGTRVAERI